MSVASNLMRTFLVEPSSAHSFQKVKDSTAKIPEPDTLPESALTTRSVQAGASGSSQSGTCTSLDDAERSSPLVVRPHGEENVSGECPLPTRISILENAKVVGRAMVLTFRQEAPRGADSFNAAATLRRYARGIR